MKKNVLWLCLGLASCASYYNGYREQHYFKSCNGPELVVPAPLTSNNLSHFYDLPLPTGNMNVSVRPPNT